MPRLSKSDLFELVESAIKESGWNILYLSRPAEHPRVMQIYREEASFRLRIYIWNLTHGGGSVRPADEYRIQVTGIDRFENEAGEKTLILGWSEFGVFAAFDFHFHSGALGASPSIQIRREFLVRAYENGIAPCNRGNGEIAIAVRPDFLVEYIRQSESLHQFGDSDADFQVLDSLSQNPFAVTDEDVEQVSQPRQQIVSTIRRHYWDTLFRERVLTAYGYRCAMCGVQLNLVQAAHIVPVSYQGSTDETKNGLALCELHHVAFDRAFIGIGEDYEIKINENEVEYLRNMDRADGLDAFVKNLRPLILLPPDPRDRPNREYVHIGNEIRGWPS